MKLYLKIDIRPYLRMWKSKDNGTLNKKVMKKFYELFAQPSYYTPPKFLSCKPAAFQLYGFVRSQLSWIYSVFK